MPRSLILFLLPRGRIPEPEEILDKLEGASLKELRAYFEEKDDKVGLRRLDSLSKIIVGLNGRFSKVRATSKDARLIFSYLFRGRYSYISGGERRIGEYEVLMEHNIWVRTLSGLMVLFDVPKRRIAYALAQLISLRLYGDIVLVNPLHLERSHLSSIERWVTSKEHEVTGNIIRATFRRAQVNGTILDEVSIKKEGLDVTEAYFKVKSSAHEISALTFVTPLLPEIGRRVTCKLDNRGGLMIYTPNLRDVDIEVIISRLERVLGLITS